MRAPKARPSNSLTLRRCVFVAYGWRFVVFAQMLISGIGGRIVSAEDFTANFDGPRPSWQVRCRDKEVRLTSQERHRDEGHAEGCEFLRFKALRDDVPARIEHEITPTRVLDEFEVRLWMRATRPGPVLAVRISFLDEKDPETGAPLSMVIPGDTYHGNGEWRELVCRTSDKAVNDQLRLLRARKKAAISSDNMFVDRVLIGFNLQTGSSEIWVDELTAGPIVRIDVNPEGSSTITQVRGNARGESAAVNRGTEDSHSRVPGVTGEATSHSNTDGTGLVPVEFRLHRLRVENRPFFPIISAYRDERPDTLGSAGFNVAWVAENEIHRLAAPMRKQGLWLSTTPPFARDATGEPLESDDASLLPFQQNTSPVLFWMMGARMTASGRPKLQSWANQVRDADRQNKRPLAADVADDEKLCSRHLDLLGVSRHVLNSEISLLDYRDALIQKRDRTWPGTFCWTWIQAEPTSELMNSTTSPETAPVIEPEQLRMQVYAALAAGCRGVGYWTTTALDGDSPGSRERLLALTQLNLELNLMEPWLATGASVQLIPFTVGAMATEAPVPMMRSQSPTRSLMNGTSLSGTQNSITNAGRFGLGKLKSAVTGAQPSTSGNKTNRELMAALIPSEFGALLLPMWLDDRSQFVPGQLAASNATVIVPGGFETATAWEISTTGRLQHLVRENVAGGMKIILPKFDQTAAILITTDMSMVEKLNQRIAAIQSRSASTCVELCRLKLNRVRQIDLRLHQLGVPQHEHARLLSQAKALVEKAESALNQQQFHAARLASQDALQLTRMYQRAVWEQAIKPLSTPIENPYTLCFQTLPEHWRLSRSKKGMAESAQANILPSGEFEDLDTLIASGWKHEQRTLPGVQAAAELHPSAKQGQYSLRLAARPAVGEQPPRFMNKSPVSIVSPAMSVHAGQVVHIHCWVKLPEAVQGNLDGAIIYDSLLGKTAAWHIKSGREWQAIELDRVVGESQEMTITIALNGLGELIVDDLRVTTSKLNLDSVAGPIKSDPEVKPARFSPLESLDIRRLLPSQTRTRTSDAK